VPTDGLFASRSLRVVKLGLDAFALRGRVIAQNIANMATPGYRAEKVAFEESLREALANGESMPGAQTRPEHRPIGGLSLDEVRARVFESEEPLLPGDPNNVIVEQEMADLAQNQLLFQAAARMAAGHYATLKAAIRGHGR
jgi:flagellar basal-body rod protein FlgB